MIKRLVFLISAATLLILSPERTQASLSGDTITVVIISANDMHAKIDNFPKFKALVDDLRKQYENVLVFSAGDNFTGNPVVDQFPDKGFPMIELMNTIGFTAGAIGNHEFDYGQEILMKRMKQANFPFISANISPADPSGINPLPYKIVTLHNGLKIAVWGVIQLNPLSGLPDSHPSRLNGITFTDGLKKATEFKWLRDSCNIFIGLTHLGYETDIELATIFPEPDVILGGHSHTIVSNPAEFNGVLIMQAGSDLKNLAKITLKLVDGKVVSKKAETISVVKYTREDSTIMKMVDQYNDNKELNRVIGTAQAAIKGNDELGSLITDGMAALDAVDVAIQNNGGIRIDSLRKGNISIKDIYKLDPFGNEIILFNLTAAELKSLIISAYRRENSPDLQISGLNYTLIIDKQGAATDVRLTFPDGTPCDDNRVFATGLSSYIASSYPFDHEDQGSSLYITTAQALINFISEKKEINYSGVKRVFTETK